MQATILELSPGALSDYYDWMKDAAHGSSLVYWRGSLQRDRQVVIPPTDIMQAERRLQISVLNAVAFRIMADAKAGHLTLTQKKIGDSLYEYRATRKRQTYPITKVKNGSDNLIPA
jgi:hypothetical protein